MYAMRTPAFARLLALVLGLSLFPQTHAYALHQVTLQSTDSTGSAPVLDRKPSRRKIVKNGGATDPTIQFLPAQSQEQASRKIASAEVLLSAAEHNLNQLAARSLDASQQQDVSQLRNYIRQARTSLQAGNLDRANILARKANVLTADMLKH
jgi:hypothetical protein